MLSDKLKECTALK
jgi:hypothetical protein